MDDNPHGTHITGTIGTGIGVTGVAWNRQIMAIKITNGSKVDITFNPEMNIQNMDNNINLSLDNFLLDEDN